MDNFCNFTLSYKTILILVLINVKLLNHILKRICVSSLPLHMQLHWETVGVTIRSSKPVLVNLFRNQTLSYSVG